MVAPVWAKLCIHRFTVAFLSYSISLSIACHFQFRFSSSSISASPSTFVHNAPLHFQHTPGRLRSSQPGGCHGHCTQQLQELHHFPRHSNIDLHRRRVSNVVLHPDLYTNGFPHIVHDFDRLLNEPLNDLCMRINRDQLSVQFRYDSADSGFHHRLPRLFVSCRLNSGTLGSCFQRALGDLNHILHDRLYHHFLRSHGDKLPS